MSGVFRETVGSVSHLPPMIRPIESVRRGACYQMKVLSFFVLYQCPQMMGLCGSQPQDAQSKPLVCGPIKGHISVGGVRPSLV